MARLEDRLARALGEDAWHEDLAGQVLCLPGQVFVTATHVDLVASLESISLPVRRAGLDRDPGWVAELGRVVLFHFD